MYENSAPGHLVITGESVFGTLFEYPVCDSFPYYFCYEIIRQNPLERETLLDSISYTLAHSHPMMPLETGLIRSMEKIRSLGQTMQDCVELDDWMDYCRLYRCAIVLPEMLYAIFRASVWSRSEIMKALDACLKREDSDRQQAEQFAANTEKIFNEEGF